MIYKKEIKENEKSESIYSSYFQKINCRVTLDYLGKNKKANFSWLFLFVGLLIIFSMIFVLNYNFAGEELTSSISIISSSLNFMKTMTGFVVSEEVNCEEINICENVTVVGNCTNETVLNCEENCSVNEFNVCENVTVENIIEECNEVCNVEEICREENNITVCEEIENCGEVCKNVTIENIEEVCEIVEKTACEEFNCRENIVESCEEIINEVCEIKQVCETIVEQNSTQNNITDKSNISEENIIEQTQNNIITDEKINESYQFKGIKDYVDAGNDLSLNFGTGDFTVEAWFKLSSHPTNKDYGYPIVQKTNTDYTSGWWLWVLNMTTYSPPYEHSTRLKFAVWGEDVSQSNGVGITALELNTLYHIVGVRGTNYVKIYLNGILECNNTRESVNSDSTENLLIGTWIDFGSYFNGTIDNVRIFNRSLSADEITALYEQKLIVQEKEIFNLKVFEEVKE